MAAPPVAQHVDDDVLVELLPEVHRQPGDPHAGFGIVAVDVEDRCPNHFRDIGAVLGRPGELRCGGEADLVVHDDVDGAAGAVSLEQRQVQRLGHHALAGERGIPVQHQRNHGEIAWFAVRADPLDQVLLGAY